MLRSAIVIGLVCVVFVAPAASDEPKRSDNKPQPVTKEKLLGKWEGPKEVPVTLEFTAQKATVTVVTNKEGMRESTTIEWDYEIDAEDYWIKLQPIEGIKGALGTAKLNINGTLTATIVSVPPTIPKPLQNVIFTHVKPKEKTPFRYVPGTAYHVLPGTHTDESGYFSLCEGHNGKVYVGTAAYGFNAYLVEFDPKTGKQRIVVDVNKVCGLATPEKPTYAAQSKIHTRNFVGPSGKIYVGSKQGYRRGKDDTADYPGGYVMVYDPSTDKTESLGMPFKGEGVNDVTADEKAGLIYVVTCEDHHWMIYDMKSKQYREPDPQLRLTPYAQTLIDHKGRAVVVTRDFRLARFDPASNKLDYLELASNGKPVGTADDKLGPACWAITDGAKTAYLIRMSDSTLFRIDLTAEGPKTPVTDLGRMIEGKNFDSRGSLIVGHDQKVYALMRIDNETGFGKGYLHHLVSHDPATKKMADHGVLVVRNPDWFDFSPGPDGKPKPWSHGFHKLPDGTWTPLHVHMALCMAKDGTLYATSIYPFTLFKIDPKDYRPDR